MRIFTNHILSVILFIPLLLVLTACDTVWNNPNTKDSRGNVLHAAFSERPKFFDPARSYSSNEYTFIAQIYEPPLQYHYLKRPYELDLLTAKKMPLVTYVDADGNEVSDLKHAVYTDYEIEIQPNILYQPHPALAKNAAAEMLYYPLTDQMISKNIYTLLDFPKHSTRELLATDYVYQIKRLADPMTRSPLAGVFAEHIVGFSDFREEVKLLRKQLGKKKEWLDLRKMDMKGVQELGHYRYRIRVDKNYPQFIYWLAMPFFAPMPWEADAFYSQSALAEHNINLNWYPIGTGAYMLTENNPNMRMILERNPNYREDYYPTQGELGDEEQGLLEDAGKKIPFIDKAVFSLEKEDIPYWNKFLQGYYDSSGVSSDSFDQAVAMGVNGEFALNDDMREQGMELITAIATSVVYIGFNMLDSVVGGYSERARKLRRAISIAVDFEEYISIFLNERGIVAQGPLAPGIFGYQSGKAGMNQYIYGWQEGVGMIKKPLSEAKRLLKEAGYKDGIDQVSGEPLVLYFDAVGAGPDAKSHLNWMRKQLAKLKIQLVIRNTDYNRFQDKMLNGNAQIFRWGWNADYPDPENFFFLLYGPRAKAESGGSNAANYKNPEFDRLFEKMKTMPNNNKRQIIINEMLDIIRRDAPWIWGFHPKTFSLNYMWHKNVKPNLMSRNTMRYHRLDHTLREKKVQEWNHPVLLPFIIAISIILLLFLPAVRILLSTLAENRFMSAYILRRVLYAIPILIGINVLTFLLFFVVNSPDDIARMNLGHRHITQEQVDSWKEERGYNKPLIFNNEKSGLEKLSDTIFFNESVRLFVFDFGHSDSGRDIGHDIQQRMWPSLAIAIPTLLLGLMINITFALIMVFFRATYVDFTSVFLCIVLMSISGLFYIIGGQYMVAKILKLVPISGYATGHGVEVIKFLILPIFIGVISGIGAGSRWYRTIFLEESSKDYVRTAKAKGLGDFVILFRHVLRNALIPILTGVVVILPLLFMGSLITESFFGIPGLGSYTIDAISRQDFSIIRSMVFLGAVLYIVGLLLTDISYALVDPRVRLS